MNGLMVTREEAIGRMERAIGDQQGGGFRPGSFVGEARAALDALLDYLEANQARMLTVGGGQAPLGHAYVSELVSALRREERNERDTERTAGVGGVRG